jgi:transposase
VDCVRKRSLKDFTESYRKFCKKNHYNFQANRPEEIYVAAKELVAVFPKDDEYKQLVQMGVEQVITASAHAEQIRKEMNRLAQTLPEYNIVMSMRGVGTTLGPQLMAEIGDVSRFTHREALTAFAGVDPGVDESGQRRKRSNGSSKCGSPRLRRTLFLVMDSLLKTKPIDDPVYQFLDRKRSEGKIYKVYMTAVSVK